ncbi:MAG: hypothetical protein JXB32_11685 [Deltaproteobacteria bacterium]|nr:hypothetical protein [Deltaproteobacteria bacterium]
MAPASSDADARSGRRSRRDLALILGLAAVGTASAAVVFSLLPPWHVVVGAEERDVLVPLHYQLGVFPAYLGFVAAALLDTRGTTARGWLPRILLALLLGVLAAVRLGGALPLSGHALACAALIVEGVATRRRDESRWIVALASAGLLLTGWYKVVEWGDPMWFGVSMVAGGILGLAGALCGRRLRGR